jgi:hypothetical protein
LASPRQLNGSVQPQLALEHGSRLLKLRTVPRE